MRDYKPFLSTTDWAGANVSPFAGDASNRKYGRIEPFNGHAGVVLMDSPPELGEDVRPFIQIGRHLCALGLSAPQIYAADQKSGFLILEDLGDDLFARVVEADPGKEAELYRAATDVLITLHRAALPNVARYDTALMTSLASLAFDKYQAGIAGMVDANARDDFIALFSTVLSTHLGDDSVLILRDYHAENLLWLPDRSGVARVGLLDFQDAMIGHPAYDLVSLLRDARRDVSPETERDMIAHYVAGSGQDPEAFEAAYALLCVQRNLRILGVFARLSVDFGRSSYLSFVPRV